MTSQPQCYADGAGTYELVGPATGAGDKRDSFVVVYRNRDTGQMYFCSTENFTSRMTPIESPLHLLKENHE